MTKLLVKILLIVGYHSIYYGGPQPKVIFSLIQVIIGESFNLQLKYQDLETELSLARQQQRRMIDKLSQATTLNTSLQNSLVDLSQTVAQEEVDREKAKNLKNKVEEFLAP